MHALSFCQQISVVVLLAITHGTFRYSMNMLMTEQMNQCQMAGDIFSPKRFCQAMVNLNFFFIEEGFSTFQAATLLFRAPTSVWKTSDHELLPPAVSSRSL